MKSFHFNGPAPLCTNSFLLITGQGSGIIIDACAEPADYLARLRENKARLVAILQTHGHFDHVGAIAALKQETGCTVYLSKKDAALFSLACDEDLTDGERLTFDELTFEVIATPGHTPGSVCLRCGGLLFTGDTLFAGDIGRTDLEGGSYTEMQQSLRRLLARIGDEDPQVLPGHEEFSTFQKEKQTNYYLT